MTALETLGYKPFHGKHVLIPEGNYQRLFGDLARARTEGLPDDAALDALVGQWSKDKYTATLDGPSCFVYEHLMERYPRAKVLLSVRDSSEQWAKSVVSSAFQIPPILNRRPFRWVAPLKEIVEMGEWLFVKALGAPVEEYHPDGITTKDEAHAAYGSVISYETAVNVYKSYVEKVKRFVPRDRLLVYNVKDGWEPLCNFFGPLPPLQARDCPPKDMAFPHMNASSSGELHFVIMFMKTISWIWPLFLGLIVYTVLLVGRAACRSCINMRISAKTKGD